MLKRVLPEIDRHKDAAKHVAGKKNHTLKKDRLQNRTPITRLAASRIMRYFIVIYFLALPLVGCVTSSHDKALRAWFSPRSTLEQRAGAVSELVPIGASRQSAERVLGTFGVWSHIQVHSMDTTHAPSRPLPVQDFWSLDYRFSDGKVTLFFDPPSMPFGGFLRVAPYQGISDDISIPATNAL